MLTLPAEPRPQTGLMDSLPAVAPSFVSYGASGSRRSPRKNHVTERRAALKPYGKPTSPTRKPRLSSSMVQMDPSVPSRFEPTGKEASRQEQLNFSVATETVQEKLRRPPISPRVSSLNRTVPSCGVTSGPLETRSLLAPESAPKGWVIGPLFQSFRSKMASFTEIVMSPVKLFKSNSTESDVSVSEPTTIENTDKSLYTFAEDRIGSAEWENQLTANQLSNIQKSEEEVEEEVDILKVEVDNVVPWQTPKTELEAQSASNTANTTTAPATAITMTTACESAGVVEEVEEVEEVRWSARKRTRQNKTTPKTKTVICDNHENFSVEDTGCNLVLTEMDSGINRQNDCVFKDDLNENQADQTPTSRSFLDDAGLKKVKRTLNLSEETGKRKKIAAKMEEEKEEERVEAVLKRKPKRKEETPIAVSKAVTRANKKSKVEQEAILTVNNQSSLVIKSGDDLKSVKAKAKAVKRAKTSSTLELQNSTGVKVETLKIITVPLEMTENAAISTKKRKTRAELRTEESRTASDKEEKAELKTKKNKMAAREISVKGRNINENVYFEITPLSSDSGARDLCGIMTSQSLQEEGGVNKGEVSRRRSQRMDIQRRKCHVFKSRKGDEGFIAATLDDAMFKQGSSTRLLRSQSCPEIPWLRPLDTPWTPHFHSPPRSRSQPPQQQHSSPLSISSTSSSSLAHHFHRSSRRARRHTVCSLEVEREIAPLCLRKEVYPARRSPSPYDPQHLSPMRALSPGASLSALASGFLSSPLAFLSKRSECSPLRALSPGTPILRSLSPAASSLRSLSPAPSSSAPSLSSLLGTSLGQLPGFHLRTDTLLNASSDSSTSGVSLLVCPPEVSTPEEDEDTSSSSPESEELREETAHSDSEIKVKKADGQRKVSSIKIRKALPKPQNNLTPMGLPRAVRVKKKEFSLEEIYTNKNFSKPPESRLETIFEAPLSRKNGAEAWCGQKRLKRFLEFPELGESRRPKKPLVGAAKANAANSRKRRSTREDPALAFDPDSLLCAKLEQLASWLAQNYS